MKFIFKLQLLLLLIFAFVGGDSFAQLKLDEGFEGTTFPPTGWSRVSIVAGSGAWARSTTNPKFGVADAVSAFTTAGADNYLISKRFVPASGDSVVFWLAQTFTALYADTMKLRISTTDSLVSSMTTVLLTLTDTQYPLPAGTYARYAVSLNSFAGSTCWLAWQHKDLDGETIRIDGITVGVPVANQITIANVSPSDTINNGYTYAPKATFTNSGSANQFGLGVNYQITGAVGYSSGKVIDTLLVGQTKTVVFDSTFTPTDTGSYTYSITSSVGDAPPAGGVFQVINRNWGRRLSASCNYWWSNSISPLALPNRPTYGWKDPNNIAQKVVMVNNGVNQLGSKLSGSLDDGYYIFGDTLSAIGKCIRVCGTDFNGFYPATNGVLALTNNNTAPANLTAFTVSISTGAVADANHAILLPFFKDLNFTNAAGQPANRFSFYIAKVNGVAKELVVTWENVLIYTSPSVITNTVSFQACIELVNCGGGANSNIRYTYNYNKSGSGFRTLYGSGAPPTALSQTGSGNNGSNLVGIRTVGAGAIYYRKDAAPLVGGAQFEGPLFTVAGGAPTGGLALEFADMGTRLDKCNLKTVNLKAWLEGYRLSGTALLDTFKISLRNSTNPYALLETITGVTNAQGRIIVPSAYVFSGSQYYLTVSQRNSILTWTQIVTAPASDTLSYDLTTSVGQAFGSNQVVVSGAASIFSGDVNQDGTVDGTDISLVDNDAFNFVAGYVPTDVNGDGFVDANDLSITDNNAFNFVSVVAPSGAAPQDNISAPFIQYDARQKAIDDAYAIEKYREAVKEELNRTSNIKLK